MDSDTMKLQVDPQSEVHPLRFARRRRQHTTEETGIGSGIGKGVPGKGPNAPPNAGKTVKNRG